MLLENCKENEHTFSREKRLPNFRSVGDIIVKLPVVRQTVMNKLICRYVVGMWSVCSHYVVGTWSVCCWYVVSTWSVCGRYMVSTCMWLVCWIMISGVWSLNNGLIRWNNIVIYDTSMIRKQIKQQHIRTTYHTLTSSIQSIMLIISWKILCNFIDCSSLERLLFSSTRSFAHISRITSFLWKGNKHCSPLLPIQLNLAISNLVHSKSPLFRLTVTWC